MSRQRMMEDIHFGPVSPNYSNQPHKFHIEIFKKCESTLSIQRKNHRHNTAANSNKYLQTMEYPIDSLPSSELHKNPYSVSDKIDIPSFIRPFKMRKVFETHNTKLEFEFKSKYRKFSKHRHKSSKLKRELGREKIWSNIKLEKDPEKKEVLDSAFYPVTLLHVKSKSVYPKSRNHQKGLLNMTQPVIEEKLDLDSTLNMDQKYPKFLPSLFSQTANLEKNKKVDQVKPKVGTNLLRIFSLHHKAKNSRNQSITYAQRERRDLNRSGFILRDEINDIETINNALINHNSSGKLECTLPELLLRSNSRKKDKEQTIIPPRSLSPIHVITPEPKFMSKSPNSIHNKQKSSYIPHKSGSIINIPSSLDNTLESKFKGEEMELKAVFSKDKKNIVNVLTRNAINFLAESRHVHHDNRLRTYIIPPLKEKKERKTIVPRFTNTAILDGINSIDF